MVRVDVITSDSQFTVCEQGLHGYEITECKVTMQLNAVSSAVIKTPTTNTHIQPLTSGISPVVAIYDNERLEFIGSIASHKTDLWGNVEIQLDGALSWLSDIVKPPFTVTNKTHAEYINAIMTQYNAAMTENGTEERIVWFGGVVGFSGNVDIHHSDEYVNTLDLLREAVEMYGGYFFETFGDGVAHPAVGWIREPIIDSGVVIEFGMNELALESQLDFSNFATRVYAVGKTNSITYTASAPDLELEYGRRDYAIKTDAEDQNTLAAQAVAVLNARKIPVRTIEVTAAELGLMGQRADALEIGSTATLLDRKLGDDVVLMVNRIERDLINRQNTRVSLGRSPVTITGVVSNGGSSSSVSSSGGGAISMPDAVLFTPQNLTPSQQSIARNNIGAFDGEGIPTKTSELTNDSGFVTQATAAAAAPVQSVNGKTGAVVLKTSDLQNDSGYITSAPVSSVNGKTGSVVLDAEDVGALPDDTFIPSKTSELINDSGFVTETDAVYSVNGYIGPTVTLDTRDIPNMSGYITADDIPQEVPTADASANGMVLGVENGRYTFVRMTGGISDVYMGGASIIQSGTTIAVIPNATTSSQGVVQLYDGTDSTSKSLVPTADALRGVAQRVGNLETRSTNWLTETQIKELIDSMVQEQIAMYQRRVFALEDNKEDIDISSLSDLTSSEILYGDHWKQIGTNSNFGAVLYNPESKTIGGSSSDLIYLKRGYIIGVSKNSWFVTSDQNWYCSHVFLSYPKMQAVYAYDEENNIRYIAADIPAEIVEQAKVLAEDFLSQIESLETEI